MEDDEWSVIGKKFRLKIILIPVSYGNMVSYTELTVQWPSLRNRRRCFKICLHLAQQGRQEVITFKCDIEPNSVNIFFDQQH